MPSGPAESRTPRPKDVVARRSRVVDGERCKLDEAANAIEICLPFSPWMMASLIGFDDPLIGRTW